MQQMAAGMIQGLEEEAVTPVASLGVGMRHLSLHPTAHPLPTAESLRARQASQKYVFLRIAC